MRRPLPTERVEGLLDASTGLTSTQAQEREARYGLNRIVESPPGRWTELVRETARDPMIWFLAATALLFAWLGDVVEAAVLAVALLPIAGMDAYLYRRTRASTEGLSSRLATVASVMRDGVTAEVPSTALVPGDLVVVTEGDAFPTDGLVVAGTVQVDESALTGEAMPVRKAPLPAQSDPPGQSGRPTAGAVRAIDDVHWGFAGTRVLAGEARLRVVFTGAETIYGEIVRSAQAGRHERTPLQRSLDSLVKVLLVAALAICAALALTRFLGGHGIVDAVMSAVTLAVAALPEEFPVVFAFYLGVGIYRLAQRQALVRRAVVVENIGRVTCICSDKTGTLTEGRLELAHVVAADGVSNDRLLAVAAAASRPGGDPLDMAILAASARSHGDVLATFPFTEDRRRECAALRTPEGNVLYATKGAPETIFSMTTSTPEQRLEWLHRTKEFALSAHKVIACAELEAPQGTWSGAEPEAGYTLLGILAFEDPIREDAAAAVAIARGAGIHVIMVTGDHPATAQAVAVELGIGGAAPRVVEGAELEPLLGDRGDRGNGGNGGDGISRELRDIDVIARAAPAQKLGLVRALQRSGEIVAVTGDGVNDVPALQGADVGIAMGERGTRSAREVAAIVLLDDNFRTIVRAIAEGRQLFRNLRLSFAYLLMVHIPLVLTAALIPFAGFPLLYLPAHIVWLELIIHPTAIFAFQQDVPGGALVAADRSSKARFFDRRDWLLIGGVGLLLTIALSAAYVSSYGPDETVEHARAMAIALLVVGSAAVTVGLSRLRGAAAWSLAAASVLSAVLLIQIPQAARLLHLEPLHADDWLVATASSIAAALLSALFVRR